MKHSVNLYYLSLKRACRAASLIACHITGAFVVHSPVYAQSRFTAYDGLPGIVRSYKPLQDEGMPAWAKLLYGKEINFNVAEQGFREYMAVHPGEHSAVIRYYKLWKQAVEPYVLADGTIRLPDPDSLERTVFCRQLQAGSPKGSKTSTNSAWTFLGPAETFWLNESSDPGWVQKPCPWQVNVYAFDVAPSDPGILYGGTETGYMNKTTDKGLHWNVVGLNYVFGGSVTSVAIHPQNPDIVYVSAGKQVHRTTDGGLSWAPLLPAGAQFAADKLKIDPANPNKIYAAAAEGIFVSTDAGNTWTKKWNDAAFDIELKPGNSSTVYAITRNSSDKFAVVTSANGGTSFATENSFPATFSESSGGLLAVTPDAPEKLFAVMLSADNTPYLYAGVKSGSSWTWTQLAKGNTAALPMDNYQGFFDLVLEVSPLDERIIFTGTGSLYRSVNGGTQFTLVGGYGGIIEVHPDIQDMKMLPNGESWVSTDGGFTCSTDNFGTKTFAIARNHGLTGSDFWGFDQGWNEDIVVGGRYHNGNTAISELYGDTALRMGGAESPTGWVIKGKSRHAAFSDLGSGWILPAYAGGNPEGRFAFSKYPNMDEYGGRRGNMIVHTNYYGHILLGEGTSVWKTEDMGQSFDLVANFPGKVLWMQNSYSNPAVMYADIVGKGLYRSSDGGTTWMYKSRLTDGSAGTSYWKGKLFFAVSPFHGNTLYACLQNGTWSADAGKVFKSDDGGNSWTDITGSLSNPYTKCLVVQPAADSTDILYLFTTSRNGLPASVYYRDASMSDWAEYNTGYPSGMSVNLALPFFRDGKIRVAGNSGVWESPLQLPEFMPLLNPWIEKPFYNCMTDTLYFEDHSILNYDGASWHWEISPAPSYISDPDSRNPKVVAGAPGSYSVSMTVTKNGQSWTKTIPGMVTLTTCPSLDDCNNPAEIPKIGWQLVYADSEEINYPGYATMSFDDDPSTIWHTRWSTGSPPYPHEIQVDMGKKYLVHRFTYLTRQDGGENGRIKRYRLYISDTTTDWGAPVDTGSFINTAAPQTIELAEPKKGRYFRLVALSEVNVNPWASAAEFSVTGCNITMTGNQPGKPAAELNAYPLPTSGIVHVDLPRNSRGGHGHYTLYGEDGRIAGSGSYDTSSGTVSLDLSHLSPGMYLAVLRDADNVVYRIRMVKSR